MARFVMEFERPLVELEEKLAGLKSVDTTALPELASEITELEHQIEQLRDSLYASLSPWERVQISRHPERPKMMDYLNSLFEDTIELRGDRHFGDDQAMVTALATLEGRRVMVIGHRKGRTMKENLACNFGSPHPEGFRKAERAMRLAGKFGLPVVTFLDTAGAAPGIEDENRGQAWAIAQCISTLSDLPVPVVVVGVGEGGSGGALAIGFGDRLIMLENAYYSVISPEMCAVILLKDGKQAAATSQALRLTAAEVASLGIADEVISEPLGGAHHDPATVIAMVGERIKAALDDLADVDPAALVDARYRKIRAIGVVSEDLASRGQ